jgi:hypothetical protein
MEKADVKPQLYVKILPHCDLFMRGVTYAYVSSIKGDVVYVISTCSVAKGRRFKVLAHHIEPA